MTDFNKAVADIAGLTAINSHTEAYKLGCQMLVGLDREQLQLQDIIAGQDRVGYLTDELASSRFAIYTKMLRYAKKQLTEEQYAKFYMAF